MKHTKMTLLLLGAFVFATMAQAQDSHDQTLEKEYKIFKTFHQRAFNGEYPMRQLPTATATNGQVPRKVAKQASFNERVWFPGEWEEVKAVVLTVYYIHLVPGHEDDPEWYAEPVVKGWADYYHEEDGEYQLEGSGPYTSKLDTVSNYSKVFYYLMDGIQKGGAEAWVRVKEASDTLIVHEVLERMGLRHDNMRFLIEEGNSIWYRDCGPICFYYGDEDKLGMLDFFYRRYNRSLDDQLPSLIHRQMGIPNYITDFVWEGGNCLVDGAGSLVTSETVYKINDDTEGPVEWDGEDYGTLHHRYKPALTKTEVRQALNEMLGQRATHIVPQFRFDGGTGHVDLYADAWNENGFAFSIMPERYQNWYDYIIEQINITYLNEQQSLFGRNYYTMSELPFPSNRVGNPFTDQEEYNMRYSRTYANHTFVNNLILQPCFSEVGDDGMPTADWDKRNIEAVKEAYPGYTIYCIDIRGFDGMGGAIHCVTKQIPADNPIRILHKNIHGDVNLGELTAVPFSAIITNKSGIDHAALVYRTNSGEWQRAELTANGNRWYTRIPASTLKAGEPVDYYFEATSVNGKTITKPFTASQGGYFTFTPTADTAYDAEMFDFDTQPMPKDSITFDFGSNWVTEDTSEEDATGMMTMKDSRNTQDASRGGWFNLSGQRVTEGYKGIVIQKGKKRVKHN